MSLRLGQLGFAVVTMSTLSLLLAGCAVHQEEQAAQWYFDGAQYEPSSATTENWHSSGASLRNSDLSDEQDWSDQTYVYRGGRDPVTGLAYKKSCKGV